MEGWGGRARQARNEAGAVVAAVGALAAVGPGVTWGEGGWGWRWGKALHICLLAFGNNLDMAGVWVASKWDQFGRDGIPGVVSEAWVVKWLRLARYC